MNEYPLIPRQILFGNPDRTNVRLSPDGAHLSWLAPVDGVLNVWVAPRDDPQAAEPVTHDTGRGIHRYWWAYSSADLLYVQDRDGDENYHLYAVDLVQGAVRDLTPLEGVQARIQQLSHKHPDELLVALNDRDEELHDLYRLDLRTGERTLVQENPGYADFLTDDDMRVRAATRQTPDGGLEVLLPGKKGQEWVLWQTIPQQDAMTTWPIGFDASGDVLYLVDSRGRDTAALLAQHMTSGETELLAEDPRVDASGVIVHPTSRQIQAVAFVYARKLWEVLDPAIEPDLGKLQAVADGEVEVVSRTLDDSAWVVAYVVDDGPLRYYLYDRPAGTVELLFTEREALVGL
ncbi:MAG: TolB family protein, partial [Anaerolineae bacterium]